MAPLARPMGIGGWTSHSGTHPWSCLATAQLAVCIALPNIHTVGEEDARFQSQLLGLEAP